MKFAPKPDNEFTEFMTMYYNRCRDKIPQVEALCAKWSFEDLIPGMSDCDSRFIYRSDMTVDDWCEASMSIGQVHLDICTEYPKWARILEHLPGINITWDEFADERLYYPEYHQWTFYETADASMARRAGEFLARHEWDDRDEFFFLKKFLTYYGPYDREIDPAINLGVYADKYPLHSRFMHYFTPPVQAVVSILLKKAIRGKMESICQAQTLFPDLGVFEELIDVIEKHYEVPQLYLEPAMGELETRLFDALKVMAGHLAGHITIIDNAEQTSVLEWKKQFDLVNPSPILSVFDNTKWARQMRGRLWFYAHAPAHFDAAWCIEIELNRIGKMYFVAPFGIFRQLSGRSEDMPLLDVVEQLRGSILTDRQADCTIEYHELTSRQWPKHQYKEAALKIVDVYEDFYRGLYSVTAEMDRLSGGN